MSWDRRWTGSSIIGVQICPHLHGSAVNHTAVVLTGGCERQALNDNKFTTAAAAAAAPHVISWNCQQLPVSHADVHVSDFSLHRQS